MIVVYQLVFKDFINKGTKYLNKFKSVEDKNVAKNYMTTMTKDYILIAIYTEQIFEKFNFVLDLPIIYDERYDGSCIFIYCNTVTKFQLTMKEYYCFKFMSGIQKIDYKQFIKLSYNLESSETTVESYLPYYFHYTVLQHYFKKIDNLTQQITSEDIIDKLDDSTFL